MYACGYVESLVTCTHYRDVPRFIRVVVTTDKRYGIKCVFAHFVLAHLGHILQWFVANNGGQLSLVMVILFEW